jgi:hypothetical protein
MGAAGERLRRKARMSSQSFKNPERDLSFGAYPSCRAGGTVGAMKPTTNLASDQGMRYITAQLEASVGALFGRFSVLHGFSVQDRPGTLGIGVPTEDGDLYLADLGLYPQLCAEDAQLICEEIRDTLVELIDKQPQARELLSGRTFARVFH